MASPFNGYISNDGKAFESEIDAVAHDVKRDIEKSFPEMRIILRHDANFNRLLEMLQPLTELIHEDRLYPVQTTLDLADHPETTLEPGEINVIVPAFYDFGRYQYHAAPDVTQVYFNGNPATQVRSGVWTLPPREEEEQA